MTLAQAVLEIFFPKLPLDYMRKMGKGDNSVMALENLTKGYLGNLHLRHNL